MFSKKDKKKESNINLWSVFFFNPIAIRETDKFKKELVKSTKQINPAQIIFEELTSFLLLNAQIFPINVVEKKIIKTYGKDLLQNIKTSLSNIYENYLNTLTERFLNQINKNKELKEAINLLFNHLCTSNEYKEDFLREVYESIKQWTNNYLQVIRKSKISILNLWNTISFIDMGEKQLETPAKKNIVRLVDELILHNFSSEYYDKTIELLSNILVAQKSSFNMKINYKNKNLLEAFELLKGKSYEIIDNIHDIRRQIARLNRAEDTIIGELSQSDNPMLLKTFSESNYKEKNSKIVSLTNEIIEQFTQFFQKMRKIELAQQAAKEEVLNEEAIKKVCQIFVQMELVRIWSEFFYDISYFTIRQGKDLSIEESSKQKTIATKAVLVVQDVYKTYELPNSRVYALRGVSFNVNAGEFIAIMGPSGAGKTTLVNILTGLDSPDKGAVYLNQKNIALMEDKELTHFRRDHIGLIFQFYQLFAELTTIENVSMPAEMANIPIPEARARALEILKIVELERFANQYPDKLSGGQQQRVAIARALINNPSIIVADQLTGDLDSITGQQIIGYLRKINKEKGTTILLVTHNKMEAMQADRLLMLEDGEIIEEINLAKIQNNAQNFEES